MKKDKLYVRIDRRLEGKEFGATDYNDHIKYLSKVADERYFRGGGFEGNDGGMIVFGARDIQEAEEVASNDPIIKKKLYSYELYEWDVVLKSKESNL